MKNTLFTFIVILLFSYCQDEKVRENTKSDAFSGSWKLIKSTYSIGDGQQHLKDVEGGHYIYFKADGSFESDMEVLKFDPEKNHLVPETHESCKGGTYFLKEETLTLNFNCESGIIEYKYLVTFENTELTLSPLSPIMCIEGCSSIYQKIPER